MVHVDGRECSVGIAFPEQKYAGVHDGACKDVFAELYENQWFVLFGEVAAQLLAVLGLQPTVGRDVGQQAM